MSGGEHSGNVSKKFIGNVFFWGITLRWFLRIALRISTAHYFRVISARTWARAIFLQLDNQKRRKWSNTAYANKKKLYFCDKILGLSSNQDFNLYEGDSNF